MGRKLFASLLAIGALIGQKPPAEGFGRRTEGARETRPGRAFEADAWRESQLDRDRNRVEDGRSDSYAVRMLLNVEVAKHLREQRAGRVYMDIVVEAESGARFGIDMVVIPPEGGIRLIETRLSSQRGSGKASEAERAIRAGEELTVLSSPRSGLGETEARLERGSRFRPTAYEVVNPEVLARWRGTPEKAEGSRQGPEIETGDPLLRIRTPRNWIVQDPGAEAMQARKAVESGVTLYRIGEFGKNSASEAQFWTFENPARLSPREYEAFRQRYGVPEAATIDFVVSGTLRPGAPFVTRYSEAIGSRKGGGLEVVTEPGGILVTGTSAVQH